MAFRPSRTLRIPMISILSVAIPQLDIYTGAQPANADTVPSGTLLASVVFTAVVSLHMDPAEANCGSITLSGPAKVEAIDGGTAGWGRLWSGESGGEGYCIDVSVGTAATDVIIDDAVIVAGDFVTVTSFDIVTFSEPA